jgi:2-C-methyl-D-erythritol 4-phosphate cytidylyltransferase
MENIKKYALIVAGGSGMRMESEIPKQFLELCGLPVLMHSMRVFKNAFNVIDIVLVLPDSQIEYWKHLCKKHQLEVPHRITYGGETRFHSVKNGLDQIGDDGLVGIHDGVRPLVSIETIQRCYNDASFHGNAIPVTEVVETIRTITGDISITLDRSQLRLVQTPQVFRVELIKAAFTQPYRTTFTDDASVLESYGGKIHLTDGNKENIKITHPIDLLLGEQLMKHVSKK